MTVIETIAMVVGFFLVVIYFIFKACRQDTIENILKEQKRNTNEIIEITRQLWKERAIKLKEEENE